MLVNAQRTVVCDVLNVSMSVSDRGLMAVLLRFTSVEFIGRYSCLWPVGPFSVTRHKSSLSTQPSVTDEVYGLVMTPFCTQ